MKKIILALIFVSFSFDISCMESGFAHQKISWYTSQFVPPNEAARRVLVDGQILAAGEEPRQMMERVVKTIADVDVIYPHGALPSTHEFAQELGSLMDQGFIVLSTPILTNAGRFTSRPLSACVMPPVDLRADFKKIKEIVNQYHQDGMGTGYDLSEIKEPIEMLRYLNEIAVEGARSTKEQRPVGNMAILDVDSPYIEEFIDVKVGGDDRMEDWKFNISVNITDEFIDAVEQEKEFTLSNGKKINAKKLFLTMANAAHQCGDPGLISVSRLNKDNPTPDVGEYKCTAPCAEVGLAPGETCVFGYINLGKFVLHSDGVARVDFDTLKDVARLMIRALDDILEISISHYSYDQSKMVMTAKRKVGIGICGFADLLISLNLSYSQQEACELLQDILNFISFHSKVASMELAEQRGSFSAINTSRYMDESFIMDKYGRIKTPHVSVEDWLSLAKKIISTKLLRNCTTTALPPTGRSAQVIGASRGVEPLFSLYESGVIYPPLVEFLKRNHLYESDTIEEIKRSGRVPGSLDHMQHHFITATEVSPDAHLAIVVAAQKVIDEAISKTINLPEEITPEEIAEIYKKAFKAGLKGMTVYRNNSRKFQPKVLSSSSN